VVVVGGGVIGVSTARALAKRGASVIMLEQNTLTSGTTWHAAGLLGTLKHGSAAGMLANYSNELYREMIDEAGQSMVGHANTGSLYIARSMDSMEQILRACQVSHATGLGHNQRLVTPLEIKDLHPHLDINSIVGGVHSPNDGICNPGDVTMWMAKDARKHGATILERTECVGINFDKDLGRVTHVRIDSGEEISCGSVVLCGGAWTKKLSRLIDGRNKVPVAMIPHQYVIFEKTEGVGNHLPVIRDVENKYYVKPEVGGFMVGVFEGEPLEHLPPLVRDRNSNAVPMPKEAEHELYEESFEKGGRWLEAAMGHVPVLGNVGIKQWLHGPDTHSPDHSFLVGRLPGCCNAYIGTGFNSQGIQTGPGVGLAIAESILDGAPHSLGVDMSAAEPSRVFPDLCEDAEWVEMRAAEGYGKEFGVHFPLEIFESARGRRLSPVHSELLKAGAVFGETYGWERPLYFPRPEERRAPTEASPWQDNSVPSPAVCAFSFQRPNTEFFEAERRECVAARGAAALFDLSSFGKLLVSGPKSLEVLQKCMTAEMDKKVGSVTYSLFCDTRGGVQGDLTVTRLGLNEFYVTTIAIQPGKVAEQLHHIATDLSASGGCVVEDITEAKAMLAINGPQSRNILKTLCQAPLDNDSFPPYTSQDIHVAGTEVLALRVSFAGELGWELHVTPLEAGLAFACKLKPDQPDFIGKAAILAQRVQGWRKRLVSVMMSPGEEVSLWGHEQELLYRDGELVGNLASGTYSHTLGRQIALGFVHGPPKVPAKWLQSGSYELEVPIRADGKVCLRRFPVEISTRCLVDPEGARVLGKHEPPQVELPIRVDGDDAAFVQHVLHDARWNSPSPL